MVQAVPTPTYRVFVRNYNWSPGRPVEGIISMDMELRLNDVSTCVMTMTYSDFMTNWAPAFATTGTYLSNKTTACAMEVGTGVLIWRNQDTRAIFNGPLIDFHRVKKNEYDDTVELTFESDETYLKRRLVFPDAGGSGHTPDNWEYPYFYDPTTHLWDMEWQDLNSTNTGLTASQLMTTLVSGNAGQGCGTGTTPPQGRDIDYPAFQVGAVTGYVSHDVSVASYTDKLCTLLEMCQILARKDTGGEPYYECIFEVHPAMDNGSINTGGVNNYVYFDTRSPQRKETTVIFSFAEGNVTEFDFREHVPTANVMYVQGDGSDKATRIWHAVDVARVDVKYSMDRYGWFEDYTQKSDFEGTWALSDKLTAMEMAGYEKLRSEMFNIQISAKVIETAAQKMSPDWKWSPTGGESVFWLGDYVTVRLDENVSFSELVRQINIKYDSEGETLEAIVGPPTITLNTDEWYTTMGALLKLRGDIDTIQARR